VNQDILKQFEPIFYPKSIAVVGASSDDAKSGTQFLRALVAAGYQGKVYAVNKSGGKSYGIDIYPDLVSIPGPVEYVIVAIPRNAVPQLLEGCVIKGVRTVQLFTAGYRESGNAEGIRLEKEIVEIARRGHFRLIGPNCIGIYNPSMKIPYGPMNKIGESGPVGFISQSGGHGGRFIELAMERSINFSKLVSFGNGADLDCVDYLEYFTADPETKIIGAYLESVSRGRQFFELLRRVSAVKPVVIWKGGRTEAGAEAAASHTGALSSSYAVWKAAMTQTGAIGVESLEELADTIVALEGIVNPAGRRVAMVSGMGGGGGGESVLGADTCISQGLEVPRFSDETRRQIGSLLPPAGTILRNPVDLGGSIPSLPVLERIVNLILADDSIDILIIQEHLGKLMGSLLGGQVSAINDVFISSSKAQKKPLVMVTPAWAPTTAALELEKKLRDAGLPVFRSFETAARSIAQVVNYFERRRFFL
jgi:acyl-CoA synthetase (NDP forming)